MSVKYQQTLNGGQYLLFDSGIGEINRIFATNDAKHLLSVSGKWFGDGKFCNHAHDILRLLDVLPNFPFNTSEMKRDY